MSAIKFARTALAVAALLTAAVPAMAEPVDVGFQFKCQACHVNRLREVRKPKGPLLVDPKAIGMEEYGEQDSASTNRMCLSCHDGFVMDSRFVWDGGHMSHPVGKPLPEGMAVVEVDGSAVMPLNEDGEVYCGTCHIGHPVEGAPADAPTFVRVNPADGQICSNCHVDKTEIAGSPHARVRKNQKPDYDGRGICGKCHTPHDNKGPLMWAKPTGEGNVAVNRLCATCHGEDPSPNTHPAQVLAWSQPVREALIGKPAVEMPVFDDEARHASRGVIGCPTCHNPHRHAPEGWPADVPPKYLRVADTDGFMCADCHASSSLMRYKFFHSEHRKGR